MLCLRNEPCRGTDGHFFFKYERLTFKQYNLYICIFPLLLSFSAIHLLFIQTFAYLTPVLVKVNDYLIVSSHIHTYRKRKQKSLTLKYTNIWIFKSRENIFTNSPRFPFFFLFFSGGDENRLLQLKIDFVFFNRTVT